MSQPWTSGQQALADDLDRLTGLERDGGERKYGDDDMSDEERSLAEQFDQLMAKPTSREDEEAADRRARRDYSQFDTADAVSLAMKLDALTGIRP